MPKITINFLPHNFWIGFHWRWQYYLPTTGGLLDIAPEHIAEIKEQHPQVAIYRQFLMAINFLPCLALCFAFRPKRQKD